MHFWGFVPSSFVWSVEKTFFPTQNSLNYNSKFYLQPRAVSCLTINDITTLSDPNKDTLQLLYKLVYHIDFFSGTVKLIKVGQGANSFHRFDSSLDVNWTWLHFFLQLLMLFSFSFYLNFFKILFSPFVQQSTVLFGVANVTKILNFTDRFSGMQCRQTEEKETKYLIFSVHNYLLDCP